MCLVSESVYISVNPRTKLAERLCAKWKITLMSQSFHQMELWSKPAETSVDRRKQMARNVTVVQHIQKWNFCLGISSAISSLLCIFTKLRWESNNLLFFLHCSMFFVEPRSILCSSVTRQGSYAVLCVYTLPLMQHRRRSSFSSSLSASQTLSQSFIKHVSWLRESPQRTLKAHLLFTAQRWQMKPLT